MGERSQDEPCEGLPPARAQRVAALPMAAWLRIYADPFRDPNLRGVTRTLAEGDAESIRAYRIVTRRRRREL